jgi:hypothetical protein
VNQLPEYPPDWDLPDMPEGHRLCACRKGTALPGQQCERCHDEAAAIFDEMQREQPTLP